MYDKDSNQVLDIIISFIKACKKGKDHDFIESDGKIIWSSYYLLNQILRQYKIEDDHVLVSVKANELWNKLKSPTDKGIKAFCYRNLVVCDNDCNCQAKRYKGASNNFDTITLHKGSKFVWKDLFHDEHVIPIKNIIQELCALETLDYQNVLAVLNKIYICKMLKEEDRNIKQKNNRPFNVIKVIEEVYSNTKDGMPIEVVDWQNIKLTLLKN